MTLRISMVEAWNPQEVSGAASDVGDAVAVLASAARDVEDSAAWTRRSWSSPAAERAFSGVEAWRSRAEDGATRLGRIQDALEKAATALDRARMDLVEWVAGARAEGFDVDDDGRVSISVSQKAQLVASVPVAGSDGAAAVEHRMRELAGLIGDALSAAERADTGAAEAIDEALGLTPPAAPPAPAATEPSGKKGHGWTFTWKPNWGVTAGAATEGAGFDAISRGGNWALDSYDDDVLGVIARDVTSLPGGPEFLKVFPRGISGLSLAGAIPMARVAVNDDIASGMDAPTAYLSEYSGAITGVVVGDKVGSKIVGAGIDSGNPLVIVGGVAAAAVASVGTGYALSKGIQGTSHWLQSELGSWE